jgi:ferredoxin
VQRPTPQRAVLAGEKLHRRNRVVQVNSVKIPTQCRQCKDAPCGASVQQGPRTAETYAAVDQRKCIGCGACAEVCATGAVTVEDRRNKRILHNWNTTVELRACPECRRCAPTVDASRPCAGRSSRGPPARRECGLSVPSGEYGKVFFLVQTKRPAIARDVGLLVGNIVLRQGQPR